MQKLPVVAVYGGSFDPVHKAHVAIVEQVLAVLQPQQLLVLPCRIPPHKAPLSAAAEQRLAMLALAMQTFPTVRIDTRELRSEQVSYSVTTLGHLRSELGEEVSLVFVMGLDSWVNFSSWFKWQEILQLSNLLVIHRPTNETRPAGSAPEDDPALRHYRQQHEVAPQQLCRHRAGKVAFLNSLAMPIASSRIRQALAQGIACDAALPEAVNTYIIQHHLYEEQ